MKLLSPIPYQFGSNVQIIKIFGATIVNSFYTKEEIQKHIEVFIIHPKNTPIPDIETKAEDFYHFNGVQELMNHCINNAESINARLSAYLMKVKPDLNGLLGKAFKVKKDIFIKLLTPLQELEPFNTQAKIDLISAVFTQYILDRNAYTHGNLLLLYIEKKTLIRYIKSNVEVYSEVTAEILKSNNKVSVLLSVLLNILETLSDKTPNQKELEQHLKTWEAIQLSPRFEVTPAE